MTRKLFSIIAAAFVSVSLFAQAPTGGVTGTVVSRNSRQAVENAKLELYQDASRVAVVSSTQDGSFLIEGLQDGMYTLVITAPDFLETQVQVTVNGGYVKNMFNLSLSSVQHLTDIDDDSFAAFDMDDSGYSDNPTILFGSNDVFNNIAGYNFSSVRFRTRGYSSESQEVYLAGVKLNDAVTGYGPFSLWSGLNEAMRSKDAVNGLETSDYGIGSYNGLTNVFGTASSVRKGLRGSALTNSALYRLRIMGSYATGLMDNGWAFAANFSARLGGNDWIDGVYYRSLAYYLAADKVLNDANKISFVFFGTPGERGAQNSSTQEVYDLMGDNMYNSNWGYQNGKVRNARVRKTHEPIAILKWDFTPSDDYEHSLTALYRFGTNGYTALDWYDAQDPRPDYYRNLPSYFKGTIDGEYAPDLNRNNPVKYEEANWVWTHASQYPDLTHVNWDRLYNVNRVQNGRAKYIQSSRHTDQKDFNLAYNFKYRKDSNTDITGGANLRRNTTEYYQSVEDLLGGEYFLNIDNFADRDFAATPYKVQNDLDYFLANGEAKKLALGDKYSYDYLANIFNVGLWANVSKTIGAIKLAAGGRIGYESFWRDGLMRKGLFPGKAENAEMAALWAANGVLETEESSYGKSDVAKFLTFAGKASINYIIGGNQRVYANIGYFNDAPHFNQVFLSPRTRNSMMKDLKTVKTFSLDANWQYSASGINVRATAYFTTIKDQSKVMSAYDDLQNAFSNFALSGIDQRNMGVEIGFKFPTYIIPDLSVQGVVSLGEYIYTSTPTFTQTVDNSAEIIAYPVKVGLDAATGKDIWANQTSVPVTYWASSPLGNGKSKKHFVPSTPQTAMSLGLAWNHNYWFVDADIEYFDGAYLDMNPLYRTDYAVTGLDGYTSQTEIDYMTTQEKFRAAVLFNFSVGKSWYIQRKYQLGFSFNAKNLLNNKKVKTGGYEQTRIVDNTVNAERFYRFDSKYFYMPGFNYMLNVYFRF